MPLQKSPSITVATNDQLKDPNYYARLWEATTNVDVPRREWLDAIADAIRDYEGELFTAFGTPYMVPCIDTVFGDDPDMRWMGGFLSANAKGDGPLRQSPMVERLRLIDLYFRIEQPGTAAGFNRKSN